MRILVVLAALTAPAWGADSAVTVATPQERIKGASDVFIDDPFAVREDGGALAYLTTDGAAPGTLHLKQFGGDDVTVAKMPPNITAVHWLAPERVLVVQRDPQSGIALGQVYGARGPEKERLGPAAEIAPAIVDGKPAVVTLVRRDKKGAVEIQLAAHRVDTLRAATTKLLLEDKEGMITHAGGALKPLWWTDGHTSLAALRAGDFDKSRDMRRPDRFTRLDVFSGRLLDEHEIEDVLGFARLTTDHRTHDGQRRFVQLNEDHTKLMLVDDIAEREVPLERPLLNYDPATLTQQLLPDGQLAFSLTVDPANPAALKRKKVDPDQIDVYIVSTQTGASSLKLRIDGEGRPSTWKIGGRKLVLLRKSKGFDRGGITFDVFDLGL
jgi:hypothetical protein